MWPLEFPWIMHSPNDVTLENAVNPKLKPLLMGSFLNVVKLNCLLQNEEGDVNTQGIQGCLGYCPL